VSEVGPQREADQLAGVTLPEQNTGPVVGHAAVRARIDELIGAGRYPSAILFSGPRGIGKATLAFALARRILAETGDESPARVDEQVLAGAHPNLAILRRQPRDASGFYTVVRVDEVRELRERLHQTRGRAAWRVVVADSIDDCNASAANALLKTLEEPPPQTLFLLVSHRPGLLLPTIRSRCLAMPMRPLADSEVQELLAAQRLNEELEHAVRLAGGCPRRGFEALALGSEGALTSLRDWLDSPLARPGGAGLAIADALAAEADGGEAGFARELITAWLADEARAAALEGPPGRARLASANALWDKAQALFADEESLNVDTRQTLVALFDAIRQHVAQHAVLTASEPP
jgi:DNA polymerase-3 subunit delta'